jgi:hypothetical protein
LKPAPKFNLESNLFTSLPKAIDSFVFMENSRFPFATWSFVLQQQL